MKARGLFITIEGIDGAGKGTQIDHICSYMETEGIELILLREPGGTSIGEQIRGILLGQNNAEMKAMTELLLFAAARAQLVREVIEPALAEGKWILCDRFFDSTLAYQAGGRGLDRDMVQQSILLATGGLEPDCTLYLDLDPDVASERRARREESLGNEADRIEREDMIFKRAVRAEYLRLAAELERIVTINAGGDPLSVWDEIQQTLTPLVQKHRGGK